MSKELVYIADLERENRLLGERCNQLLKDKGDLTDQIADIKANCDLAIEGRDIKIKELEHQLTHRNCLDCSNHSSKLRMRNLELEKENEMLKGDLELWESGGCRATNLFKCGVVKELKDDNKVMADNYSKMEQKFYNNLTKATDLLKKMYYLYFDPCVTHKDLENRDKLFEEVKQFLKEIEK